MKLSRRRFLQATGAGLFAADFPNAFADASIEDIWQRADRLRKKSNVIGTVITIIRNGQEAGTRAFGIRNIEENLAMENDSVFEAASLSKPAFGYCVMQLVQEGKLDLDKPLLPHLAEHFSDDPRLAKVTTRMILSHTSGLPHSVPDGAPIKLAFEPGERFTYSATGFTFLQRAVAHLTGQSLQDFARQRLFRPLGTTNSDFIWSDRFSKNWAAGYDKNGKRGITYIERFRNFTPETLADVLKQNPELAYPPAAAGLYTTAQDYARFLLAKGRAFSEMTKPQVKVTNQISWGIGWGLFESNDDHWLWHWGNWNGLSQHFVMLNQAAGDGIIVLTNSGNGLKFSLELAQSLEKLDLSPMRKFLA